MKSWLNVESACNACGVEFQRENEDFVGAYTVNLIVAELLVVTACTTAIVMTWPDVPWDGIKWSLVLPVIAMPFVTYPFSRAIYLAVDMFYRPDRHSLR